MNTDAIHTLCCTGLVGSYLYSGREYLDASNASRFIVCSTHYWWDYVLVLLSAD